MASRIEASGAVGLNPANMRKDAQGESYLVVRFADGSTGRLYQGELDDKALAKLDFTRDKLVSTVEASVAIDNPQFRALTRRLEQSEKKVVQAKDNETEPGWFTQYILEPLGWAVGVVIFGGMVLGAAAFSLAGIAFVARAGYNLYQHMHVTPQMRHEAVERAQRELAAIRAEHAKAWQKAVVELSPTASLRMPLVAALTEPESQA
ncbi:MAG: hypothetical protein AAB426_12730 [Myxococcota bacterium]